MLTKFETKSARVKGKLASFSGGNCFGKASDSNLPYADVALIPIIQLKLLSQVTTIKPVIIMIFIFTSPCSMYDVLVLSYSNSN